VISHIEDRYNIQVPQDLVEEAASGRRKEMTKRLHQWSSDSPGNDYLDTDVLDSLRGEPIY
jgi:hypothetical protein